MKLSLSPVFLYMACQPALENEIDQLGDLIEGMRAICDGKKCIGLAANQVGSNKQIMVLNCQGFKQVIINPVIERAWGGRSGMKEGCLSFPGRLVWVIRHKRIRITGVDEHWKRVRLKPHGLVARAIQHEYDHLLGITMFDRAKEQQV